MNNLIMSIPFISLCIPTYKRIPYLKRLLESILVQTYKDFEIVITDNSDDDSVKLLAEQYAEKLDIKYYKNIPSVSMAENWNINAKKARGKWLKVIHDDDYFATPYALERYAKAAQQSNSEIAFIVGGYKNYYENSETFESKLISQSVFKRYVKYPYYLFAKNMIGPPSVIMVKREKINMTFDERLTWRVDIDFYINALSARNALYIRECLIVVSCNPVQTTNSCINNISIEIPESLILYNKHHSLIVKPVVLYDTWWRLIRNLKIRRVSEIKMYANEWQIPFFMIAIVQFQQKIPVSWLKNGWISKLFMSLSYVSQRIKGRL